LELKVSEFKNVAESMDTDIKGALLYDLGYQREMQLKNAKQLKETIYQLKTIEQQFELKKKELEELKFVKNEHTKSLIEYEKSLVDIEDENSNLKKEIEQLTIDNSHQVEKLSIKNTDIEKKMKLYLDELEDLRDAKNNLQNDKQTLKTQLCELETTYEDITRKYSKVESEQQDLLRDLTKERNSRINLESELDSMQKGNQKFRSVKLEQEDIINRLSNEIEMTKTRLNTESKEKEQILKRLESVNNRYNNVLSEFTQKEDDY